MSIIGCGGGGGGGGRAPRLTPNTDIFAFCADALRVWQLPADNESSSFSVTVENNKKSAAVKLGLLRRGELRYSYLPRTPYNL